MTKAKERLRHFPPGIAVLIVLVLFFSFTADNYLTWGSISTILVQAAPLMVLALGQTFVVLTQGTDLSLGSSISLVTVVWMIVLNLGMPMPLAILTAVAASTVGGLINGFIVAWGGLPPFIATLGMQYILRSVALVISDGASVYFDHPVINTISRGQFLFLPISVWVAIASFIVAWALLYRTRFGNRIFALGGNAEALTLAGANTKTTILLTFAFAGVMAGVAGLLVAGRVKSGNPLVGVGWEFNALSAVLLGGTSMREGNGSLFGTIFGVLLIQVLKSGLNAVKVPSVMQSAIIGSVVILAIIFDAMAKRRQEV